MSAQVADNSCSYPRITSIFTRKVTSCHFVEVHDRVDHDGRLTIRVKPTTKQMDNWYSPNDRRSGKQMLQLCKFALEIFIAGAMFVNDISIRIREQYCVTHLSAQPPPRKRLSTTDDLKDFVEYDQTQHILGP